MEEASWDKAIALIIGALLAGGGRLVADWLGERKARIAYLTAIKTEISSLCSLISSQRLVESLDEVIAQCEAGALPRKVPSFDIRSNYFSCFEALGSDIKFLSENECRDVVEFYILMKAGFDTIRKDGPLQTYSDPESLAQGCRFLSSVIGKCFMLNRKIEKFPNRYWFA